MIDWLFQLSIIYLKNSVLDFLYMLFNSNHVIYITNSFVRELKNSKHPERKEKLQKLCIFP